MVDLCAVGDESEGQAIAEVLRDHGIEAVLAKTASSPYPSLSPQGFGVVRVDAAKLEEARRLLEDWRRVVPAEDDGEAAAGEDEALPASREHPRAVLVKSWPWVRGALLVGSLVLNVYGFVKFVWQPQRQAAEVRDARGELVARFHYRPFAAFPRMTETFGRDGALLASFVDADDDGRAERGESRRGELTSVQLDSDEDGSFELIETSRGGRKTAIARDDDGDGLYEVSALLAEDGAERARLVDRDRDGFYETVQLGGGREQSLLLCR